MGFDAVVVPGEPPKRRITNEQREAIVRKAIAERDAILACPHADQCAEEGTCANGCQQVRADFEVWAARHGATEFGRNPNRPDEYQMAGLQGAWLRYQSERSTPLPVLLPRDDLEVLVEALTDESGTDYCVSIALGGGKVRSKWGKSEAKAEKLAATIRDAFGVTGRDGQTFSGNTPLVSGDSEANKEKG